MLNALLSASCPECGSNETEWHCGHEKNCDVVDGRLRMHDIGTVFFLGCSGCSETIRTVRGDELARLMTEAANSAAFPRRAPACGLSGARPFGESGDESS